MGEIRVVDLVKKAYDTYCSLKQNREKGIGMCFAFDKALMDTLGVEIRQGFYWNDFIPLFNEKFLTGRIRNRPASFKAYWWDVDDVKSRKEAFQKLIDEYEKPANRNLILKSDDYRFVTRL